MATKNNPGQFDCYAKAEPDEPLFVLLARDKHAPTLVWLWAALRELDDEKPEKILEAQECMTAMMAWAHARGVKPIGIAQAALVGTMECVRAANTAIRLINEGKVIPNDPTTLDFMRLCLSTAAPETPAEPIQG